VGPLRGAGGVGGGDRPCSQAAVHGSHLGVWRPTLQAMEHHDPVSEPAPAPADPDFVVRLSGLRAEPAVDGAAPTAEHLALILETAVTVPDHGDLEPWRFAVCTGAGRDRFAQALVDGLHARGGADLPDAVVAKMRSKAYQAPCAVMVIASPDTSSNVQVWEQVVSASCTGYALVLAATGLGYGAVWKSANVLDTEPVRALFGAGPDETLLGWVNLGTPGPIGRKKLSALLEPPRPRVLLIDA